MNKIEEVARAICGIRGVNPDCLYWNDGSGQWPDDAVMGNGKAGHWAWRHHAEAARAAITAMRAPTDAMIVAGIEVDGDGVEEIWRNMSHAALMD